MDPRLQPIVKASSEPSVAMVESSIKHLLSHGCMKVPTDLITSITAHPFTNVAASAELQQSGEDGFQFEARHKISKSLLGS